MSLIDRLTWQDAVLAATPKRLQVLGLPAPAWPRREATLRVHRNQAYEVIEALVARFAAFAGLDLTTTIGDYDDSLMLNGLSADAPDAELVFLDFARYGLEPKPLAAFLGERLKALRARSPAPILVVDAADASLIAAGFNEALAEAAAAVPGARLVPLSAIAADLGPRIFDARTEAAMGTRLSAPGQLAFARLIGLKSLPARLLPRFKALAVDLDNTLYRGVLGENGVEGVELTEGHKALQRAIVELAGQGVLVTLTSKNEDADVEALLARRADFPLRPEHLAGRKVNWQPKHANISALAAGFNIAPDAFLMIDDNPGELAETIAHLPGLGVLLARPEGAETARELALYPRLEPGAPDATDRLRAADLAARAERLKALENAEVSIEQYLREMGTTLTVAKNPRAILPRLCEVPHKVNQFNLALRRLTEAEVHGYLDDPDAVVVAASLKDRLSDSGNVGALYGRWQGDTFTVEELCLSCRSLGRGIETVIVTEALAALAAERPTAKVAFHYRKGPRNGPGLDWLAGFAGAPLSPGDALDAVAVPADFVAKSQHAAADPYVTVVRE